MDSFCGGPDKWGPGLNENASFVDFTPCFEDFVIMLSPVAFILFIGILRVIYLANNLPRTDTLRVSWLYRSQLLTAFILAIVTLCDMSKVLNEYRKDIGVESYEVLYAVGLFVAQLFVPYLMWFERNHGQKTSSTLSLYWLMSVAAGAIKTRSLILRKEHYGINDTFAYNIFFVYYAFMVLMFVLSCIPESKVDSEYQSLDENPNKCPEKDATLFSNITFWWINPLVVLGYKKSLEEQDLWDLDEGDTSKVLGDKLLRAWEKETKKENPSIYRAMGAAYGRTFFFAAFFKICQDSLSFVSPQLLDDMIAFTRDETAPVWQGYAYAFGMMAVAMIQSVMLHQYFHRCMRVGMQIRSGVTAAIYRKALNLSNSSRQSSTVGEIVNLMSVDAQRFQDLTTYFHMIWSAPFQIALSLYFLYQTMGLSVLAGVGVMILMIPLNAVIAIRSRNLQKVQMVNKDSRIKLMSEILAGIKVLKLYAWETPFMGLINVVRQKELKVLKSASYLNAFASFAWTCSPFLVSLATFVTYTVSGNDLTAEKAFVALTLFNILQFPLSMLPFLISSLVEASVSNKRLKKFLLNPELDPKNVIRVLPRDVPDTRMVAIHPSASSLNLAAATAATAASSSVSGTTQSQQHSQHTQTVSRKLAILTRGGNFKWTTTGVPVLHNINFEATEASLVAVVGRVGCGKSSFISALLGDMEKTSGDVYVLGSVAYVPQQPWIQNATLRDNILFGKPFDQARYEKVVEACALKPDIEMLPGKDLTEIGEKGINLSGGQKQRVSVARAVYQNCDVYLFDDPLSAVDAHVGKHILDNVLGPRSLLKDKCRVLVTHSVKCLPQADKIVVMKDGKITETGSYSQLKTDGQEFAQFLADYASELDHSESTIDLIEPHSATDGPPVLSKSQIAKAATTIASTTSTTSTTADREKQKLQEREKEKEKLVVKETVETGSVKLSVYRDYAVANGFILCVSIAFMYVLGQGLQIGSNVWLSKWSSDADADPVGTIDDNSFYLGIYAALGIGNAVAVFLATFVQALGSIHASDKLHSNMLARVLRSPMSFFDTTPMGRVVNRFSKDVYILDETIPASLRSFLGTFFRVISIIVVIAYSTPLFLAAIVPLGILYIAIQRFYIATSRQLKRLDSVSRSPIYAHFSETLTGVSSIRAYNKRNTFIDENAAKVDANQKAYYPNVASNRWLAIRLEFIGSTIVFLAALFAVIGRGSVSAGLVGLSISYALSVTQSLNWMVRMSSELETNIVAVERIKEYTEIETEAPAVIETSRPPFNWPDRGMVEFINYTVRYREGLDLVLKGIDCRINGGERIGICGRTGAGKSSLTLSLFRIIEAAGGRIVIDGIDISTIGLEDLRTQLNIIPQDPVLFSGTVRSNLDPLNRYEDSQIWRALERSHLKEAIQALELKLDAPVNEGGENFSVGQRQLICLARALLRKTKILVLDEATSALDVESDSLIQKTIRTEFADCTVLTIAHRLNTILDSDRIMVLDGGRICEFAPPHELLANKSSVFYGMAKSEGVVEKE